MAPIERFPSNEDFEKPGQVAFYELVRVVEGVSRRYGLLRIDEGEDEQTLQQFRIFTIGANEGNASVVVLIGNQADISGEIEDLGKDSRPNKLIAPRAFIAEVKTEIERIREASKLSTVSPQT